MNELWCRAPGARRQLVRWLFALGFCLVAEVGGSQQPVVVSGSRGAIGLSENVRGLGTTTRVLMIGAHPDDEDTQLIAWLAKARHVETAYLSLTRGDGGQNLIGNELGEQLGKIRTEELLAARRIDGGRQYFARAFDFGFSKSLDETMRRWPRDSLLKDMVAIVRAFRPHVIVNVWTGTPADGHGHHQYAGVLGREVFDAAADTVRFPPSSVGGLKPWTAAKFYRGRRQNAALQFNVGEYDPLTGQTFSEIATTSRSEHRSQGQGGLPQPGPRMNGVQLEVSRVSDVNARETSLFAGLDTSWNRFRSLTLPDSARSALDSLVGAERAVRQAMDLVDPSRVVQPLERFVRLTWRAATGIACSPVAVMEPASRPACDARSGDFTMSLATTLQRATSALLAAAAVRVDATVPRDVVAVGDTIPVTLSIYNQGRSSIFFESAGLVDTRGSSGPASIAPDSVFRRSMTFSARAPSSPWWLIMPLVGDTFDQNLGTMVLGDDRVFGMMDLLVRLRVDGAPVWMHGVPIVYRRADAVLGEVRRPLAVVPRLSVTLDGHVEYARANVQLDRQLRVTVRSGSTTAQDATVTLWLPNGLTADSVARHVRLEPFGTASVYFRLRGRLMPGRQSIRASASVGGEEYFSGYVPIEYDHIPPLRAYRRASMQVEAVNATFAERLRIGYIRGVGDNVMPMLEQLGLSVTELDPQMLPRTPLSRFTTIVLGPRAYEANPAAMAAATQLLMKFASDGGTIVTQYGQQEMTRPGPLPYPITLAPRADRVTDENAPVRALDAGSPLLNTPNRITDADFAGWVQERSLYMPRTFAKEYRPVISINDQGEPPNDGSVLVAPVGKGAYVYTSLAFFRQLPAGHPGAARLFINLLSADQRAATRPTVSRPK